MYYNKQVKQFKITNKMKRLLTILSLVLVVLTANAQKFIPQRGCSEKTYAEVIELLDKIEKTSLIEKMEGIQLDNEMMTTYWGEVLLRKEGNSIIISIREYTAVLEDLLSNPRNTRYEINHIRTELCIQTVKMYEYIYKKLYFENWCRGIKNVYIKTNQRTGGTYIQIEYKHL